MLSLCEAVGKWGRMLGSEMDLLELEHARRSKTLDRAARAQKRGGGEIQPWYQEFLSLCA